MRAKKISYAELESAFPWVRHLPDAAARQFMDIIDNYCEAAAIYSRARKAKLIVTFSGSEMSVLRGKIEPVIE